MAKMVTGIKLRTNNQLPLNLKKTKKSNANNCHFRYTNPLAVIK